MNFLLNSMIAAACLLFVSTSHSQGFLDGLRDGISNALDQSKSRINLYNQCLDKNLLDQFYFLSEDGKQQSVSPKISSENKNFELVQTSISHLTLRQIIFRESSMMSVTQGMRSYSYDSTEDIVGKIYISFANERGNIVKIYKPALNGKINRLFNQNFKLNHARNTSEWLNLDNALIETSPDGKIISALTRSHQAIVNIGATSHQYINIYFGKPNSQAIENSIKNSEFTNEFIRISGNDFSNNNNKTSLPSKEFVIEKTSERTPLTSTPTQGPSESKLSLEQRIKLLSNLNELKKSGALSESEFETEKNKLLNN